MAKKIIAQGSKTLIKLFETVQVKLTNEVVAIPCSNLGAPSADALAGASTTVEVMIGTSKLDANKIRLTILTNSPTGVTSSIVGNKVSITAVPSGTTVKQGYVDINVYATVPNSTGERFLGAYRFSFAKVLQGDTGSPGTPGTPGISYTINILNGVRGIAYSALGTLPDPSTSSAFSVSILKNGVAITPYSYSWSCGGNLSGVSTTATFTPVISSLYSNTSTFVKVVVKETSSSANITETVPIICTKHADGLDWIGNWNSQAITLGSDKLISPKIFAGTKNASNQLTGVALGRDVLGGNSNNVIGLVGYKNNKTVFCLDQNANFFVSSSGLASDIQNGKNGAKGLYFNGTDLYISGKVTMTSGSSIPSDVITSSVNSGSTTINGGKITTGTITSNQISAGAITAEKISFSPSANNLLKNGAFLYSATSNPPDFWSTWGECSRAFNTVTGKRWLNIYKYDTLQFRGIQQITEDGSFSTNTTYTISLLAMPYSSAYYNKGVKIGVHSLNSSNTIVAQYWNNQSDCTVGGSSTKPQLVKFTFTTGSESAIKFNVMIGGTEGASFDFRITDISMVKGDCNTHWTPHVSEVYSEKVVITDNGIVIKNNAGSTVMNADDLGNLKLAGNIASSAAITGGVLKSTNGDLYFDLNNGFMIVYNGGTKIGQTIKNKIANTSLYGMSSGAEYGSYASLSAKTSSSSSTYNLVLSVTGSELASYLKKGVNLGDTFNSNNWNFKMGTGSELQWRQADSSYDSFITEGPEGMLRMYGDNGVYLGYRVGSTNTYIIALRESGSHTYPKALSLAEEIDTQATDENGYSVEICAPINMNGKTINGCSNIKTLGIEIIEPITTYGLTSEEEEVQTSRILKVTKSTQDIVEFIGSSEIINGECIVYLPIDIAFKNYVVLLTPIGLNKNVSIIEKENDYFKLVGDDCLVDYVIKFETVSYAKYIANSLSVNNIDIIERSEADMPITILANANNEIIN